MIPTNDVPTSNRTMEIRSSRVLIQERFQPAVIRIHQGKITAILSYDAPVAETISKRIDFGDQCIGPGLVDLAPSDVHCPEEFLQGGITTVVVESLDERDTAKGHSPHVFQFGAILSGPINIPKLVGGPDDALNVDKSVSVIVKQADTTNSLASPFRGTSREFRATRPGNSWRTGRTRAGSDNSNDDIQGEDLPGVALPKMMVETLMDLEKSSYEFAPIEPSSSTQEVKVDRRRRPPPIASVKSIDYFAPQYFLKNYRVHLALRPVENEFAGLRKCLMKPNIIGVLRLSSESALSTAESSSLMTGCTIAHLVQDASRIKDGYTQLKMDPPIREPTDRVALLAKALQSGLTRFSISSGHSSRNELFQDFERTSSNGSTARWMLPSLVAVASQQSSYLEALAILWSNASSVPAAIACLRNKGHIKEDADADIVVINIEEFEGMCPSTISPLYGVNIKGRVTQLFLSGEATILERSDTVI